MIVVHLSHLDVVKHGLYHYNETQLPAPVREEIEIFSQTVLPPLLSYVSESQLHIVIGLLGILLERVDVALIAKTKIGLAFLTMFSSRAEIIKQAGGAGEEELRLWGQTYDELFARLEGTFLECFPPQSGLVDDVYVWQFLASMAVGASMGQQQRLVTAVKYVLILYTSNRGFLVGVVLIAGFAGIVSWRTLWQAKHSLRTLVRKSPRTLIYS